MSAKAKTPQKMATTAVATATPDRSKTRTFRQAATIEESFLTVVDRMNGLRRLLGMATADRDPTAIEAMDMREHLEELLYPAVVMVDDALKELSMLRDDIDEMMASMISDSWAEAAAKAGGDKARQAIAIPGHLLTYKFDCLRAGLEMMELYCGLCGAGRTRQAQEVLNWLRTACKPAPDQKELKITA